MNTMGLLQLHVSIELTFRELVRPLIHVILTSHLTRTMNLDPTMNFEDACRWRILFTSIPAIHLLHFDDIRFAKWGMEKIQSINSKD